MKTIYLAMVLTFCAGMAAYIIAAHMVWLLVRGQ